ncbi:MAG TPA: FMN-binding protein [Gammaproteobacteria bacterium]
MKPAAFLGQAFEGSPPDASLVWLTGERGDAAAEILGHKPSSLRVRYWQQGGRTAWILEEIGREEFITAGFVIDDGALSNVQVLAFRESRGWEIKHDFFTDQFKGVELKRDRGLSEPIDNITGATLSVNAMKRMARLALYLDGEVRDVAP